MAAPQPQGYFDPNMMGNPMWNPGGQVQFATNDPNVWGQQAAMWSQQQQQQQQQQQMWNQPQPMWNPNMGPQNMAPGMSPGCMPPNMMHNMEMQPQYAMQPNMGPNMGPNMAPNMAPYGMMDPNWGQMNMPPQNWNNGSMGPPGVGPPGMVPMQPFHEPLNQQQNFNNNNNNNHNQMQMQIMSQPVQEMNPEVKVVPPPERREKPPAKPIILPDIPDEMLPQVEALMIFGVVPANRRKSQYISNTGMGFYCQVCECYISSMPNAEAHVHGVRHKQNKKIKESRDTSLPGESEMAMLCQPKPKKKMPTEAEPAPELPTPKEEEIFYEVLDVKAVLQEKLDSMEGSVIVGLSEIVEHQIPDGSLPAYYVCKPCDVRLNANNLMFHINGLRHKVAYMKTLKPDEVSQLEQKRHHEQVDLIGKLATALESELGRGKIQVVMDKDASHHPYSIRMSIKSQQGHSENNKDSEPAPPGTEIDATSTVSPQPKTKTTSGASSPTVGTVVGTKIVIRPDGTKVRVKTILRPKSAAAKPAELGAGPKTKTVVKRKVTGATEEGEVKMAKTVNAQGKVVTKKVVVKSPAVQAPAIVGLNDQPLVFETPGIVPLSRAEAESQTAELANSYILERLKHFKVETEEDSKYAVSIIDTLSEAIVQYNQRLLKTAAQNNAPGNALTTPVQNLTPEYKDIDSDATETSDSENVNDPKVQVPGETSDDKTAENNEAAIDVIAFIETALEKPSSTEENTTLEVGNETLTDADQSTVKPESEEIPAGGEDENTAKDGGGDQVTNKDEGDKHTEGGGDQTTGKSSNVEGQEAKSTKVVATRAPRGRLAKPGNAGTRGKTTSPPNKTGAGNLPKTTVTKAPIKGILKNTTVKAPTKAPPTKAANVKPPVRRVTRGKQQQTTKVEATEEENTTVEESSTTSKEDVSTENATVDNSTQQEATSAEAGGETEKDAGEEETIMETDTDVALADSV